MTWLLRLYPSLWRRRYGGEVEEMLAHRRFSFRIAVDLVAGAIDVWLHPSETLAAASAASTKTEEKTMLNRIARFDCAALTGVEITKAEQWKATAVAVGGTVVLSLLWMAAHARTGDNAYVDALSIMPFIIPFLYSIGAGWLAEKL
jgi:ABC-type transport system involved in cytochrome bd biosynthesis fused ATPase/permease subunit